ncbi:hypothetical protein [Pedobacter sp. Bi36]|uniref:hypothetical protein n=1 Tax=Pedobacter sp. Bi36 TaxID=2822352 RepID=UPI001E40225F|nr:hypothetical protein [Pedobacter sp. Bi36]
MKKLTLIITVSLLSLGQLSAQKKQQSLTKNSKKMNTTEQAAHYTFKLSDKVTREKVTFKNRYGITLSGDLYIPKNAGNEKIGFIGSKRTFWCGEAAIFWIVCQPDGRTWFCGNCI